MKVQNYCPSTQKAEFSCLLRSRYEKTWRSLQSSCVIDTYSWLISPPNSSVHFIPCPHQVLIACFVYLNMNVLSASKFLFSLPHCVCQKASCGLLGHSKTKIAEICGRHITRIFWSQAETEINALDWSLQKQQPGLWRFEKKLLN